MPSWNFYQCNMDDALASVYLDLDARPESQPTDLNILFWIFIKLQVERDDGLSHDDEFDDLIRYEDDLTKSISHLDTRYVGRITTRGMRQFYFYTADSGILEETIMSVVSNHPSYLYQIGNKHDPEWSQYQQTIYPGKYGLEQIFDRESK